jgi:FAD/FMN-containing dehydrogenase
MFTASFNAWNKSTTAFTGTSVLQARLYMEPYPQVTYQKAKAGTNVLGLSGDRGALVVVGVAVAWSNASDDALMNRFAQTVVADIDAAAKRLSQHYEYKYLNYASPWQEVIQSYGARNVEKMRNVSKKYDPRGIFQKKVPGGFKLV